MSIPTPQRVGRLMAAADSRFRVFIALRAFGGLRLGEASWWPKTLRDAGVVGVKPHDLRHFYASGLIDAGCDIVTAQRVLGHGRATTTLNTYAHLWPTAEDRTRSAADSILSAPLGHPS